ncbi:MAG: hypothetical protein KC485_07710, partial [Gemmatimonadetes bacterium]|nr:hypothetical protein [Gemmatimonadota bacterium]
AGDVLEDAFEQVRRGGAFVGRRPRVGAVGEEVGQLGVEGGLVGHGQAARQSLESCVSCHVERDCTVCHSAQGGRRFNPHGPGFDAERLRRRNPEMCIACHGRAIPGMS